MLPLCCCKNRWKIYLVGMIVPTESQHFDLAFLRSLTLHFNHSKYLNVNSSYILCKNRWKIYLVGMIVPTESQHFDLAFLRSLTLHFNHSKYLNVNSSYILSKNTYLFLLFISEIN